MCQSAIHSVAVPTLCYIYWRSFFMQAVPNVYTNTCAFIIPLTIIPAARPEDFTSTELIARYNTNENKACVWLVVVNSRNVELPESLNVETSLREEHSIIDISPTLSYGIIEIRDDDSMFLWISCFLLVSNSSLRTPLK